MDDVNIIEMKNITKYFPGILANDKINLELKKGEVLALLGENGSGKTTLMNILFGLYKQDEGEIFLNGKKIKIHSPSDALNNGIGMVQQHFTIIPSFSVSENVILGLKDEKFFIKTKNVDEKISKIGKEYKLPVDPKSKVWTLSVGEKQRVEILKIL
jgi:simple sugar transport system ATP-binding protein